MPGLFDARFNPQGEYDAITFCVPAGWKLKDYAVSGLDKSAITVSEGSDYGAIAFAAKEKGEVELKVHFTRGE